MRALSRPARETSGRYSRVGPVFFEAGGLIGPEDRAQGRAARIAIVAFTVAVTLSVMAGAAMAAFPGANGRIAFIGEPEGLPPLNVFTILPDGTERRQLTNDSALEDWPSWSADGHKLLFSVDYGGGLFTISAAGGDLTRVLDHGESKAAFSPSGRRIVYGARDGIRTIGSDGTNPRRLLSAAPHRGVGFPEYSPTGRRIVLVGQPEGESKDGIWTVRRDGSRPRLLDSNRRDATPDYSPDARHIVFLRISSGHCCNQLFLMRADGSHLRRIPGIGAIGNDVGTAAYAPTGARIVVGVVSGNYVTGECGDLYTMTPMGTDVARVTHGCNPDGSGGSAAVPSWQPLPGGP